MSAALKLGIAGLGTVGAGVVAMLRARADEIARRFGRDIEIAGVCARDRDKDRGLDISEFTWFDTAEALAAAPGIDVFVELIGGEDGPALDAVRTALRAGRHVVTANKAMLAHHGAELAALAEDNNVSLNFEAAVAGGIPIVKTIRESLGANEVSRIIGILNGTCNYILTRMAEDERDFADVLKDAQAEGFAEADPSFDIGGIDAAHKLAILTALAFGTKPAFDQIYIEGIEGITLEDLKAAGDLGYKIKLLAVSQARNGGVEQRVHPALVARGHPIAGVDDVANAVSVESSYLGGVMLEGPGAGAGPTASAVIADIADIARSSRILPLGWPAKSLKPFKRARMRTHEGGYYLRVLAYDRPGAMAAITNRMAEQEISLDSIVQKGHTMRRGGGAEDARMPQAALQVVMITHDTSEAAIRKSLEAIGRDGFIAAPPAMIRIEKC